MGNKKTVLLVGAGALLLILITVVLLFSAKGSSEKAAMQNDQSRPEESKGDSTHQTASTSYTFAGTNGRKAFNMTYPTSWTMTNLSPQHRATWVELTNKKAFILINQEPTALEDCAYPKEVVPTTAPNADETYERFGEFTKINTVSGEQMRVAQQADYTVSYYACEGGKTTRGNGFSKLTSIGMITMTDLDLNPQNVEDFKSIVRSFDISQ